MRGRSTARLLNRAKLRGALSDQILKRIGFCFYPICKSADLTERSLACRT